MIILNKYAPAPTPFLSVLEKYSVNAPHLPELTNVEVTKKPGNSKLKLWICGCLPEPVRVRVAIKDFQARCLKCGQNFKQEK